MMKKLMVLSLVLAVSAMSTAALSLVDLGGGAIGVEGPVGATFTWYLGVSAELNGRDVELTDKVIDALSNVAYFGAFDWASQGLPDLGVLDTWQLTIASGPTTPTVAGIQVTGLTDNLLGWGDVDMGMGGAFLFNPESGRIASALYIPEPMTMGLLGLGALFLRRRK